MQEKNQAVLFGLGKNIFHWQHDWQMANKAPQIVRTRPRDVTALTIADGETLFDACQDGNVYNTLTNEIYLTYPNQMVVGIHGHESRLRAKEVHRAHPEKLREHRLFVLTSGDGKINPYLDYQILETNRDCRNGKTQSVMINDLLFWANDGEVYRGFDKSQVTRQFKGDYVQMIPLPCGTEFWYCWYPRNGIETTQIFDDRERRVIWQFDRKEYGNVYFAGFYYWDEEPYLLMGLTKRNAQRTYECAVYVIAAKDFNKTDPQKIAAIELGKSLEYGLDNPFIAHAKLINYSG